MTIRLVDIPGLEAEDQLQHRIRAVEINGRSPALDALLKWHRKHKDDFKKIMKVMRMVGQTKRVIDQKHVKKNKDKKAQQQYGDLYEMRADKGGARLMFFYTPDAEEVIVCANPYWKAKPSPAEQNQSFETCGKIKELYLGET